MASPNTLKLRALTPTVKVKSKHPITNKPILVDRPRYRVIHEGGTRVGSFEKL